MTENKTGDFAQILPESRHVQAVQLTTKSIPESAFKLTS